MKKILDYITNNIDIEPGENKPVIPTPKILNNNVFDYLLDNIPNIDTEYMFRLNIKGNIPTENSSNVLFYGNYMHTNGNSYGFVYVVDKDMKPLKLITTFESGTLLFPMFSMNQDEDGNLYASSMQYINNNYVHRLLLFNNVLVPGTNGEYNLILRKSYILSYNGGLDGVPNSIRKMPGTSTYYIVGFDYIGGKEITQIIEYKVNVGMENEQNIYNLDGNYNRTEYSTLLENDGSNTNYYFYSYETHYSSGVFESKGFAIYRIRNGTLTKQKTIQTPFTPMYDTTTVCAYDTNNIYIANYDKTNEILKVYKMKNSMFVVVWQLSLANIHNYDVEVSMPVIDNKIGFILTYEKSDNTKYVRVGILDHDIVYLSGEYETNNKQTYSSCLVSNYNLTKLYVPLTTSSYEFILDYNPLNYNGEEYSNYNELVSKKTRLYFNNEMVFARNLYNKTLYGNIRTSTTEIPNTLLNDTTINKEDLIGETNSVLVSKTSGITKNIYEKLYINYIESISVVDEDEEKSYPNTAIYINQNIDTGTRANCESSFVGKVRINYLSTQVIQNITWVWNTNHYETTFTIDATVEVPKIDFISNDESTTYLSKTLDIETGNYYLVKQKLRIE